MPRDYGIDAARDYYYDDGAGDGCDGDDDDYYHDYDYDYADDDCYDDGHDCDAYCYYLRTN